MDTERIATTAIISSLSKTDRLNCYINSGEKEPAWDGPVYIHEDSKHTKKNIKKVDTQVKGKIISGNPKPRIKYSVKIDDLNAYLHNNGAIYFVVHISKSGEAEQIYYNALTPFKISELLKGKNNISKISLPFERFPDDKLEKEAIFCDFYSNTKMQASFVGKSTPSIDDLKNQGVLERLTIRYSGFRGKNNAVFPRIIDGKEMYVYAHVKGGSAPIPIEYYDNVSRIIMSSDRDTPVFVKDTLYYDEIQFVSNANTTTINIGSSFSIIMENGEEKESQATTIKINLKGTLKERIQALKFLLAMVQEKSFRVGNLELPADFSEEELKSIKFHNFPKILEDYEKLEKVLVLLNVKKDLQLDNCSKNDLWKLNALITAFADEKPISDMKQDLPLLVNAEIQNLKLVLLCPKNDDGSRNLWDYFSKTVDVVAKNDEGESFVTSQYAIMKSDDFNTIDNINLKNIVDDFKRIEPQGYLIESGNQLMLEMLKAYDAIPSEELYGAIQDMMTWIKQYPEYINAETNTINELQILARTRVLAYDEKQKLHSIVNGTGDDVFKTGAFLLLDEQHEASKLFDSLDEESQNHFRNLPICKFFKNNQ